MTVEVDITHRLGDFVLDARFETGGGLTALFGRSGSGKTSLVNIVGGLIRPDRARVAIDGTVLIDTARRIFVPPHRRRLGYVFQEGRLFPHLTVRQNLLFGSWFAPISPDPPTFDSVIGILGIAHLLDRRPLRLSGGEKQRVAIGRALLAAPRLLLMDEPLASLDDARKQEIFPYLERLRDEARIPIIYVSHSFGEVARLADTAVLLAEGRVVAAGPAIQVMQRLDLTLTTGDGDAGAIVEATLDFHDEAYGLSVLTSRAGTWRVPQLAAAPRSLVRMRVRPRDIILSRERPEGLSALNVIAAVVVEAGLSYGPAVDIKLDCNGEALVARLTRYSYDRLRLTPGTRLFAIVKSVTFDSENRSGGWTASGAPGRAHSD